MDSSSKEKSVLDIGEEQLCGEGLKVDVFAETLKLIKSKAKEIDKQLLDAISWVSGNITQMFDTIFHFATWLYHSLSLFLFVSCTIGRRSEVKGRAKSMLPIKYIRSAGLWQVAFR